MVIRVLRSRTNQKDVIANNPTVAMLQAACSITCAGWLVSPLTTDAVTGVGGIVGHTLFALSTSGFIVSAIGIFQRRKVLYNFGDSPLWVGFTFPFANTAITAGLYGKLHPTYSYALTVWILFLSAIATVCILTVNILFLRQKFYLFTDPIPRPILLDNFKEKDDNHFFSGVNPHPLESKSSAEEM
jgi:tellurite resistance protein TehA-like permease